MSYNTIEQLISNTIEIEQDLNDLIEGISSDWIPCPNKKEEIEHELIVASRAVSRVYSLALEDAVTDKQDNDKEEDS